MEHNESVKYKKAKTRINNFHLLHIIKLVTNYIGLVKEYIDMSQILVNERGGILIQIYNLMALLCLT
jgi:hypothetical protein